MYRVIIEPEQPLLFGKPALGNYRSSLPFVPGTNLRGAIASQLDRDAYADLFLHQESIFFNAYPTSSPENDELPRYFPPSAVTCKHFPGTGEKDHGVKDTFLDSFLSYVKNATFVATCPECNESARSHDGIINGGNEDGLTLLNYVSTTHVGISRKRRVAQDGFLYTRVGIVQKVEEDEKGKKDKVSLYFVGLANLPEELAEMFDNENGTILHVGANRRRGMGRIRVKIEEWTEPRRWQNLETRCKQLTELLAPDSQEVLFTLDTLTPWVPDPFTGSEHPLQGQPAELLFSNTQTELATGWHHVAGLPRRSYPSVKGTFLYRTASPELVERLHQSQLGLEQDRGYGLMIVCDPYHTERMDNHVDA